MLLPWNFTKNLAPSLIIPKVPQMRAIILKNVNIKRLFADSFSFILPNIEQCLFLRDSPNWLASYGFFF